MDRLDEGLLTGLLARGVSRRSFLKLCVTMTGVLALPAAYAPRVASAAAAAPRIPLIWLRGQGCGGDTEALLRGSNPTTAELLLDLLSIDYHDSLMAASGTDAMAALSGARSRYPNGYFAVIEGAIPTAQNGAYLMTGGRPFADVVREVCGGAIATIAVGSCAFDGGLSAAGGGSTGAVGVGQVISNTRLLTLPGCPVNAENLTASILHYLTFGELPPADGRGRPLFAFGDLVHNQCGRRSHFEFGEFVQAWGDEGAQKGWCLYKMGCKGPETFANCPTVRYASGTSWPVKAGAACIGCHTPGFWDAMSPFSGRLPSPIPFAPDIGVDQVGQVLVGGVGALVAVHGTASFARGRLAQARNRRQRAEPVAVGITPEAIAPQAIEPVSVVAAAAAAEPAPVLSESGPTIEPEPIEAAPLPVERREIELVVEPPAPANESAPANEPVPAADEPAPAAELPPEADDEPAPDAELPPAENGPAPADPTEDATPDDREARR